MAQDYHEYLASIVLNEQQIVSYRNLSRALKVHVNLAKQMLYEFHRKQNSKKPGSVHATYLISGIRPSAAAHATETQQDGEDSTMRSSPPLPSSSFQQPEDEEVDEVIHTRTIMVVAEEHLDEARAQFDAITGVHIYSLQSRGLSDFQSLTECNRKIVAESASEDSLKDWKVYGVIQNSAVRRRSKPTGRPLPAPKKEEPKKVDPAKDKPTANLSKQISTASNASTKSAAAEPSKTMAKPSASKNESTSIFKSFAKTVAKPKKSESQPNSAAASPVLTPQQPDDVPMTGFSEDEDDDEDSGLPEETQDDKLPEGKTKKDRKAELEAMMDQEDEPMEDAPTPAEEQEEAAVEEQPKETVTVENGRRRGRRRVMKKKTVKDEEGYLVTREEPVWEEFSEEEPAPKKARVSVPATSNKPAPKKGGKPGQGNIMSFFAKK